MPTVYVLFFKRNKPGKASKRNNSGKCPQFPTYVYPDLHYIFPVLVSISNMLTFATGVAVSHIFENG
jgi:hypothetical protein